LKTWGPSFIGSSDFPQALVAACAEYDPAGLLLPASFKAPHHITPKQILDPVPSVQLQTVQKLDELLRGKMILNLSGGADKLVPYGMSEPFLRFLKRAISPEGWWKGNDVVLDDRIFNGVGHEATPAMQVAAVTFIGDVLAGDVGKRGVRESKI